jgi:hypothetical protein
MAPTKTSSGFSKKIHRVESLGQVKDLEQQVRSSVAQTVKRLRGRFDEVQRPLMAFQQMKFEAIGVDPLSDKPLNLIEQVNQTFTYLTTFEALRILFREHPELAPFVINLGTAPGHDIQSTRPDLLAAEVFAAVNPNNNQKLLKEISKLHSQNDRHKYVFYSSPPKSSPEYSLGLQPLRKDYPSVKIFFVGMPWSNVE